MEAFQNMITIEIPFLPKRTNQKLGHHWSQKHKEKKLLLNAMRISLGNQKPEAPFKKAKIHYYRYSSSCPDYDGMVDSFKHVQDALIELGIIEDDSMNHIGKPDYDWVKCKPKMGYVKIEITDNT